MGFASGAEPAFRFHLVVLVPIQPRRRRVGRFGMALRFARIGQTESTAVDFRWGFAGGCCHSEVEVVLAHFRGLPVAMVMKQPQLPAGERGGKLDKVGCSAAGRMAVIDGLGRPRTRLRFLLAPGRVQAGKSAHGAWKGEKPPGAFLGPFLATPPNY